jgi:hypothetical protein
MKSYMLQPIHLFQKIVFPKNPEILRKACHEQLLESY